MLLLVVAAAVEWERKKHHIMICSDVVDNYLLEFVVWLVSNFILKYFKLSSNIYI